MCEVLFRRTDKTGDSPMRWLAGMAVTVKPDGWNWCRNELEGPFTVVKLPGVDHTYNDNGDKSDAENAAKVAARDKVMALFAASGGRRRDAGINLATWAKDDSDYCADDKNSVTDRLAKLDAKPKDFTADVGAGEGE